MSDDTKQNNAENEFFVNKRELGELFDSSYPLGVNLWRGDNPHRKDSIFYPILKAFLGSKGKPRKPDIETYMRGSEHWVDCTSGGISLFDAIGVPVKQWDFYKLPAGTAIPFGLVITKDNFKKSFMATHYTIRPNWDMPVREFCMLLDKLVPALVKEL